MRRKSVSRRLEGKVALITGGAAGIGRATVERFASEGARVMIADVNDTASGDLADTFGDAVNFVLCDVTREADVGNAVTATIGSYGGLDVLVNNAGMIAHEMLGDMNLALWNKIFAVNVQSVFLASRYAVPHIRAAGGGSIINMSSMAGLRGAPGLAGYSSSKAAINGLTVALALELAPDRIRVNAICPGWVDTTFNQPVIDFLGGPAGRDEIVSSGIPLQRQGRPEEIAALAAYLAADEAAFVTAQTLSINGGSYN